MYSSKDQQKLPSLLLPAYQIDWNISSSGKWISKTKLFAKFSFGLLDKVKNANQTNSSNRNLYRGNKEHEVKVSWSIASGKKRVWLDDKEVQYLLEKTNGKSIDGGKFEISFSLVDNDEHMIKIVAFGNTPGIFASDFRQFDLFIDGCSFFDLQRRVFFKSMRVLKQSCNDEKEEFQSNHVSYRLADHEDEKDHVDDIELSDHLIKISPNSESSVSTSPSLFTDDHFSCAGSSDETRNNSNRKYGSKCSTSNAARTISFLGVRRNVFSSGCSDLYDAVAKNDKYSSSNDFYATGLS
jgi:hypothetical protein